MSPVRWLKKPERHDYDAAGDYLSLLMSRTNAKEIVGLLRDEGTKAEYKAKDIIRASGLEALPPVNKHVQKDLAKIKRREPLSPILLVRPLTPGAPLIIADGYHRACAAYHAGEDVPIPCRIITPPKPYTSLI